MFVKIQEDGTKVFPYTISDLRKENPKTSFPAEISQEVLNKYNVFIVEEHERPFCDGNLYKIESELVSSRRGGFVQKHTLVPLPESHAAGRMRVKRNRMLSDTDWAAGSDVTMSDEMRSYRQALRDITKQDGFPYSISWPEISE